MRSPLYKLLRSKYGLAMDTFSLQMDSGARSEPVLCLEAVLPDFHGVKVLLHRPVDSRGKPERHCWSVSEPLTRFQIWKSVTGGPEQALKDAGKHLSKMFPGPDGVKSYREIVIENIRDGRDGKTK